MPPCIENDSVATAHDPLPTTDVGSSTAQPPLDQQLRPTAPPAGSAIVSPDQDVPPTLLAIWPEESSAMQARVPGMHPTPTRAWLETVESCHDDPVHVAVRPSRLVATQNVVNEHEMASPGTLCANTTVALDNFPVHHDTRPL